MSQVRNIFGRTGNAMGAPTSSRSHAAPTSVATHINRARAAGAVFAAVIILTAGAGDAAVRPGPIGQDPALADRPLEHRSVPAHFAATARSRPDQVALRTATHAVTYRQLLGAALASARAHPNSAEPRAALVSAPLTPATVATMLGIFASRTPVVALDPAIPEGRVQKISSILAGHGYQLWRILTGDLTVREMACDHHSIVRDPHIGAVLAVIDEVRGPGSAE